MPALTSLANVKAYATIAANLTTMDALLRRLIASESRSIEQYLSRRVPYVQKTAALNGTGTRVQCLPLSPVLDVESVVMDGVSIARSTDGVLQSGWTFDEDALYIIGDVWHAGLKNVAVTWTAGWAGSITDTPGSTATITPIDQGYAAQDRGVVVASTGVPLTLTANAPATGEYAFAEGVYTFSPNDAALAMTCSYYYVPAAVEEACIEMVVESLHRRPNLGTRSKSLDGGGTVSFTSGGMTDHVKDLLSDFRQLAPI